MKRGWRSGKTLWTEKRKWKEMEKELMNSKFTFKTLPDGSVGQKLSARTVDVKRVPLKYVDSQISFAS